MLLIVVDLSGRVAQVTFNRAAKSGGIFFSRKSKASGKFYIGTYMI